MRLLVLTLVAASALLCNRAFAQSALKQAERDEIIHMSREEPAMRVAFERARATLDDFLREAASPKSGTSGYALKVAVSDGKNTEYFWVNRFSGSGDQYSGHLGNQPRMVKTYKFDERFSFRRDQIVDWTYIDTVNRRMLGNFTACALLTKEPPDQAAAFKKQYGLSCE
jgi:uncharacterized protein YegJ (DUF2314 family)